MYCNCEKIRQKLQVKNMQKLIGEIRELLVLSRAAGGLGKGYISQDF
jgi:hypothetical protein